MNCVTSYLQEGLFSPKLYVMIAVYISNNVTLWEMKFDSSERVVTYEPKNRAAKRYTLTAFDFEDVKSLSIGEHIFEDGYKMLYIDILLSQYKKSLILIVVNAYGKLTKGILKRSFEEFTKKAKWDIEIKDAKPLAINKEKKDKKKEKEFDELQMHLRGMKRKGPQSIIKRGF